MLRITGLNDELNVRIRKAPKTCVPLDTSWLRCLDRMPGPRVSLGCISPQCMLLFPGLTEFPTTTFRGQPARLAFTHLWRFSRVSRSQSDDIWGASKRHKTNWTPSVKKCSKPRSLCSSNTALALIMLHCMSCLSL